MFTPPWSKTFFRMDPFTLESRCSSGRTFAVLTLENWNFSFSEFGFPKYFFHFFNIQSFSLLLTTVKFSEPGLDYSLVLMEVEYGWHVTSLTELEYLTWSSKGKLLCQTLLCAGSDLDGLTTLKELRVWCIFRVSLGWSFKGITSSSKHDSVMGEELTK